MRAVDVIQRKRDGHALTSDEISFFVSGYTRGQVPDYQAAALAMAVFFQGMDAAETLALTESMIIREARVALSEPCWIRACA